MLTTLNLQETELYEYKLERRDEEQTIDFSVKGAIKNADEKDLEETFEAEHLQPEVIVINAEDCSDGDGV